MKILVLLQHARDRSIYFLCSVHARIFQLGQVSLVGRFFAAHRKILNDCYVPEAEVNPEVLKVG
jgi:hypothetical protein